MKNLRVSFENCYGIRKLDWKFDFSASSVFVIYAPNGTMKTSFARAFLDHSLGEDSSDRIFTERKTVRAIIDETGKSIEKEEVFVVDSYNEGFKSEKIATLLVNKTLKAEYERIYADIEGKKDVLVKALKAASGIKNVEAQLAGDVTQDPRPSEFLRALGRIQSEVEEASTSGLSDVPYQKIFNEKVLPLIVEEDFKSKLDQYMNVYDQLISGSTFFKKGVFNHNNAAEIAKNLKDNGFFKANHSVYISGAQQKREISNETELEKVIKDEKATILSDKQLAKSFEEIDKKLVKNKEAKEFREFLEGNLVVLPELENLPRFRQKLWIAYLKNNLDSFRALMTAFQKGKQDLEGVIKQAKGEATHWKKVIDIFNERFSVPFEVTMENQEDVILKSDAPAVGFRFVDNDGGKSIPVEQPRLMTVLSNGEKRALYILNIIFEVEARKATGQESIFIVDDIADSFDYKNKYAIVEYLSDISREPGFFQIILTHNFDFYRTVSARLAVAPDHRLHVAKSNPDVKLLAEKYQRSPFVEWKKHLDNDEMLVASIPFVRNLAEYCGYDAEKKKLTSLLHIKTETETLTVGDLEMVFGNILKSTPPLSLSGKERKVKELIYALAQKILGEGEEVMDLEKKIVLSMAIRLRIEEFLIKRINDSAFVEGIKRNQTIALIKKFKEKFPKLTDDIRLAEKVNLMTPENIHINSFMYEPILDMSNENLKKLYKQIFDLN